MPDTLTALVPDSINFTATSLLNDFDSSLPLNANSNNLININQLLEPSNSAGSKTWPLTGNSIIPLSDSEIHSFNNVASQSNNWLNAGVKDDLPDPVTREATATGVGNTGLDSLLSRSDDNFNIPATNSYIANANSKSLLFSPYNWLPVKNGVQTSDAGAYLKFRFDGTQAVLNVDTSSQTSFPLLDVYVDGKQTADQLWLKDVTNGQVKLFGGAAGSHDVTVYFRRRELYDGNNPAVLAVKQQDWLTDAEHWKVTGVQVSGGTGFLKNTLAQSKTAVFFGDSITEGFAEFSDATAPDRPSTTTAVNTRNSISYKTYAAQLGELLNVDYGQINWSGAGWAQPTTATGNPPILDSWLRYNGASTAQRTFDQPKPDYVFINLGTNDAAFNITNTVSTWLTQARQTIPGAEIFVIAPFNQSKVTELEQGIAGYKSAHPSDQKIHFLNLGAEGARGLDGTSVPAFSQDQIHPTIERHQQLASMLYSQIKPILGDRLNTETAGGKFRYDGSWIKSWAKLSTNSNYVYDVLDSFGEKTSWGDNIRLFGGKNWKEGIGAIGFDLDINSLADLFSSQSKSSSALNVVDNLEIGSKTTKEQLTNRKKSSSGKFRFR